MCACPSDRMLTKYFQKFGKTYIRNPITIYHNMDYHSNVSEKKKYRSQQLAMRFYYNESQKDKKVFLIQFNCGELGIINESEVEIDIDLKKIKTLEDELLTKYPIENIPKKIFSLKINLNKLNV